MRTVLTSRLLAAGMLLATGTGLLACGDDDSGNADGRPRIVVTTNILGDVVEEVVGDAAEIEVVMPLGADPHEFAASARQAEAMTEADLLVINGAGFEEGMSSVIDRAEESGVRMFSFADHVDLLPFTGEGDDADHNEDPHIWTDPNNIAAGIEQLRSVLVELEGIDATAVQTIQERADTYLAELDALDQEIETKLAVVPADQRVLVTNHEVFGYFAARYGFEVVGTVIPSGTTLAQPSSAELEALADVIQERHVPAIFAETTESRKLANSLAESVGDVEVVTLFTESLGEEGSGAETYVGLMRTDADLIADALQPSP